MSSSRWIFALLVVAASLCAAGCGDRVHVTGRVTFENGQPLTIGQIIFTDDFYMGKSDLDKNGEYSIHTFRRNDGIRKGTYRVYIVGAMRFEETEAIKDPLQDYRFDKSVQLIDMQHTNPDVSGWEFELKKDSRIDLIVYPPGEIPEEKRTEGAKLLFDPEYRKKVERERAQNEPPKPPVKRRSVNPKLL